MITDTAINSKVTELKTLRLERAKLDERISSVEDAVKSAMEQRHITVFVGDSAKVTWSVVTSSRFDSAAFKKEFPDEYKRFLKTSETKRFVVA